MGRLSAQRRDDLLKLMLGLVQRNASSVADVLLDWTDGDTSTQEDRLSADVEAFVDTYHGVPLAQLSLASMLADVTGILRRHQLQLPSDLALLIKAFVSVEGMGRHLDPGFHMAGEALPLLKRALRARYHPKVMVRRGWRSLVRLALRAEHLFGAPQDIEWCLADDGFDPRKVTARGNGAESTRYTGMGEEGAGTPRRSERSAKTSDERGSRVLRRKAAAFPADSRCRGQTFSRKAFSRGP